MILFRSIIPLALSIVTLISCSDDNSKPENVSKVQVALKTNTNPVLLKNNHTEMLVLEKFQINISEIEFDIDDEMEDQILNGDSVYGPTEFNGPFLIDLLSDEATAGLSLGVANLPTAVYEEVEFEFDVYSADVTQEIFGSSVYIKGTYDTTPFIIKSDEEWDIEIEFINPEGYSLTGADSKLWIDFNLQRIKDQLNSIDFNAAKDKNGNGIIEIDSADTDGNINLLENFIEALEDAFEVEEADDTDEDN